MLKHRPGQYREPMYSWSCQSNEKEEGKGRKKKIHGLYIETAEFWWHLNKVKGNERTCLKFCIEWWIHSCAVGVSGSLLCAARVSH